MPKFKEKVYSKISSRHFYRRVRNNYDDSMNIINNSSLEGLDIDSCRPMSINGVIEPEVIQVEPTRSIDTDFIPNSVPSSPLENGDDFDYFISSTDSEDYLNDCNDLFSANYVSEEKTESLQNKLATWAVKNNISHSALNELLIVLKDHDCHSNLPSDARTILKTPKQSKIRDVKPGKYCHIGLINGIELGLNNLSGPCPEQIELLVGIDGLPISRSSSSQFWPILCTVLNSNLVKLCGPFIIGIYHGHSKPKSVCEYLKDFVDEMNRLKVIGFQYKNKNIKVKLPAIVCDAPAKAFISCTKGHSGYFGCSKCVEEGEYINGRVSYPSVDSAKRSNLSFRNRTQEEHHVGSSLLEDIIDFDMVTQLPLDYMHLVCLGVMRKLINLWLRGKIPIRLESRKVKEVSDALLSLKPFIPIEFARKPRDLKEIDRWKATEYRQLLLYTGPLVFKSILPEEKYIHFMTLHVAITTLSSAQYCQTYNDYAQSLLMHFVQSFSLLYGPEYVSYNVHNLIHLADDVKMYGPLDQFSAFQFENHMQHIKKLVRKADKPLQQVVNRVHELQSFLPMNTPNSSNNLKFKFSDIHNDGPILGDFYNEQYKKAENEKFTIKLNTADNCFGLKCGSIVVVENLAFNQRIKCMVLIGRQFLNIGNFYTTPCKSSLIGNYLCELNMSKLKEWPISEIVTKFVKLPYKRKAIVLPLIHLNL